MGHCILLQGQRLKEFGRNQKMASKCDVSVGKRGREAQKERSGMTVFAFYVSSVINSKLYKVLRGYNFQKIAGLEILKHLNKKVSAVF